MSSIALVDCNNFYVSCERVFHPEYLKRPVVVLSNNDGCIVARSSEIKDLDIPMGAPYFEWRERLERHGAVVLSSNYALYGDLSQRVMSVLSHFSPDLEIYSIDEAFLQFDGDPRAIQQKVAQWTGIPVSVGIASTKTLAKIAVHVAKSRLELGGVYELEPEIVSAFPIEEVWGIGRRLAKRLARFGIYRVGQLLAKSDPWIRQHLTVVGLRTAWELRGIPCFPLEEAPAPKQSIMTSRSFGRAVTTCEELLEAVSTYTVRGAEKLREEEQVASWLQVFALTKEEGAQAVATLPEPTSDTTVLLAYAREAMHALYRQGKKYKKAGVLLGGLVCEKSYQKDLFDPGSDRREVMALIDRANRRFGYPILRFAAEGTAKGWRMRCDQRSPCYTTRWDQLLEIG